MYTRVRDCFNRPICSVPGGEIDLLDRESEDWNWTFRYVTQELVNRLLNLALKLGLVGQKGRGLYFGMDLFGACDCDRLLYTVNYFGHPQLNDRESVCSIPHLRNSRENTLSFGCSDFWERLGGQAFKLWLVDSIQGNPTNQSHIVSGVGKRESVKIVGPQ